MIGFDKSKPGKEGQNERGGFRAGDNGNGNAVAAAVKTVLTNPSWL